MSDFFFYYNKLTSISDDSSVSIITLTGITLELYIKTFSLCSKLYSSNVKMKIKWFHNGSGQMMGWLAHLYCENEHIIILAQHIDTLLVQ